MESCHSGLMEFCDGYEYLAGTLGLVVVAPWSLVMVASWNPATDANSWLGLLGLVMVAPWSPVLVDQCSLVMVA